MKHFCCGDVVPGCSTAWTDHDDQGILRAVTAHAREVHGMTDIPTDLVVDVLSNIRDVA